jgi:membrane dipeptidase
MDMNRQTGIYPGIVWDNHGCMPLRAEGNFLPQLQRYRDAGLNVVSLNVGMADASLLEHLRVLSFMRRWISERTDTYRLVSSVEDVQQCKLDGRLGVVFDIEGMVPIQNDLSFVQTFYELGVRWMLIAYNCNNKAGGGCLDEDHGLTSLGRTIIDEMERVGMVLCLSHAGPRTAADALEYSRNPPIFSHSNPSAVNSHPRNISDELMRGCARKQGVVGLNGIGLFLGAKENLIERMLWQLQYVVDLIGPEHVGLGLDYVFDRTEYENLLNAHPELVPLGMDVSGAVEMVPPEAVEAIAEGLARSNLSESQIRGILGENWLRIASRVWR